MERKMKLTKQIQKGVSMMEILITTFVVIMGLLVVMLSFVAIAKSNRYSERMDTANTLIRMEVEKVRNQAYAAIASETGSYGEYADHPDFRHEITVTDRGNVKEVDVDIYFENDRRRAEVITYVANM
jgi:Tfp pilus assembly protein PilV